MARSDEEWKGSKRGKYSGIAQLRKHNRARQPLSRQLGAMNAANERRRDEQTKKPFQTRGGQWNLSVNRIDVRNSAREIDVTVGNERRGE